MEHLGVGVGSLLLSEGGHHVHKAPVVLDATLGAASPLLLLLLLFNLDDMTGHNLDKIYHMTGHNTYLHNRQLEKMQCFTFCYGIYIK